jgi:hypothetical protein
MRRKYLLGFVDPVDIAEPDRVSFLWLKLGGSGTRLHEAGIFEKHSQDRDYHCKSRKLAWIGAKIVQGHTEQPYASSDQEFQSFKEDRRCRYRTILFSPTRRSKDHRLRSLSVTTSGLPCTPTPDPGEPMKAACSLDISGDCGDVRGVVESEESTIWAMSWDEDIGSGSGEGADAEVVVLESVWMAVGGGAGVAVAEDGASVVTLGADEAAAAIPSRESRRRTAEAMEVGSPNFASAVR